MGSTVGGVQTGGVDFQPSAPGASKASEQVTGARFGRTIKVVPAIKALEPMASVEDYGKVRLSLRRVSLPSMPSLSLQAEQAASKPESSKPATEEAQLFTQISPDQPSASIALKRSYSEGNENPFLTKDGKISQLRRSSLEPPAPSKRKLSFGSIAKSIKTANALLSLAPKGVKLSNHVVMGVDKVAGYENQGIPRENIEKTQNVADKTGTIIAYRPVELICRTLIEEGAQSKGLNIKGKSSNWGPMAGYIPYDQKFSKLAALQDPQKLETEVAKYNAKNEASVKDGHATIEHLSLSERRMNELTDMGILHDFQDIPPAPGYTKAITLQSNPKGNTAQNFEAHQNSDGKWDIFSGSGDSREKLMVIPKTADFDLLFAFSRYDQVDLGGVDRLHDFHPELGILSDRNEELIHALNEEFDRGSGNNMVHHGDDTKNPVTDMSANLPATIFIPENQLGKMGIYTESPILVKTHDELVRLFRTFQKAGIRVESNALWGEIKNVIKEPYTAKLTHFEAKATEQRRASLS